MFSIGIDAPTCFALAFAGTYMSTNLIEKADNNPLLSVRGLIDATDSQWSRPRPAQANIKEPSGAVSPDVERIDQDETTRKELEFHAALLDSIRNCIDEGVNPRLTILKEIEASPAPTSKQIAAAGRLAWFPAPKSLILQINELQKKYDDANALVQDQSPQAFFRDWISREEYDSARF